MASAVPFLSAYLVVVAMMAGSFINLAADRLPRGESLLHPRSHCRSCGRVLDLVDLIPVAGYVIRGGRCATCGAAIGAWSPIVEGMCGAFMLAPLALLGPWPGAIVGFGALSLLGLVAVQIRVWSNEARPGSRARGARGSERLSQ